MDFQLILYIIIVIVWLVLDNYKRIKKKQEQAQRPNNQPKREEPPTERPYTTLEDILREFGMDEEVSVPKPASRPVEKKKLQKKPVVQQSYETYESSINKDYKFSSETHKRDLRPSMVVKDSIKDGEIKTESVTRVERGVKDFDLRKAVIWSEILKRPYE